MRYGRKKKGAGDLGLLFIGGEHAISTFISRRGASQIVHNWGRIRSRNGISLVARFAMDIKIQESELIRNQGSNT